MISANIKIKPLEHYFRNIQYVITPPQFNFHHQCVKVLHIYSLMEIYNAQFLSWNCIYISFIPYLLYCFCVQLHMCVHEKVIVQTLVFLRCHRPCSYRKSLAFAWSWPSRLVCLVCEPEGHLGCLEDGSNPVSFLLCYNTFTSNHREEGLVCLHFQDVAHPNREVTDAGLLVTPHLQSKAKRMKVPVLPAYSH